jgi:large subunit ribosomal protein L29
MLASDIRELTSADIEIRIGELEEERFRLGFRSATEPLQDPLRLRVIRKDVARMKTILRERQISGAKSAGTAARAAR